MASGEPRSCPDFALRAALAPAFGLATATAAYAWIRALEAALFPRVNPLAIVAVTQSGFFVRCGAALVVGGMGAFGGWALSARPAQAGRALTIAVIAAAGALALQMGIAP